MIIAAAGLAYALLDYTIAKIGPSSYPDSAALPVVFVLGDRGANAEVLGDSAHQLILFGDNGATEFSEIEVGTDTVLLTLKYWTDPFPATGSVNLYNRQRPEVICVFIITADAPLEGMFPGDTFLISWNPDNPATAVENLEVKVQRSVPLPTAYPNPFNPITRITAAGAGDGGRVNIYDLNGRVAARLPLDGGTAFWNAAGRASGMYIAEFSDGKQNYRTRISLVK